MNHSLPKECSIFSAEAAAIFYAATTPSSLPILILSDSASVLDALKSESPTHPWVQGISSGTTQDVTLAWIPGHCGVSGNVVADQLAGSGWEARSFTNEVPLPDVKKYIAKTIWDHWAKMWHNTTATQLRKIKGGVLPWTDRTSLREQQIISRLRTGHVRFAYNFGRGPFKKRCESCDVSNSVEHVLCFCPQYSGPRDAYGISGSIRDTLADDASTLGALFCFIRDAELFFEI